MARKNIEQINQQRRALLIAQLEGRSSASSSTLSRSFGLPVDEIRQILRRKGVNDDG